jgi:hypothetical protein
LDSGGDGIGDVAFEELAFDVVCGDDLCVVGLSAGQFE